VSSSTGASTEVETKEEDGEFIIRIGEPSKLFYEYLPYAKVLGAEKRWRKRFKEPAARGELPPEPVPGMARGSKALRLSMFKTRFGFNISTLKELARLAAADPHLDRTWF